MTTPDRGTIPVGFRDPVEALEGILRYDGRYPDPVPEEHLDEEPAEVSVDPELIDLAPVVSPRGGRY